MGFGIDQTQRMCAIQRTRTRSRAYPCVRVRVVERADGHRAYNEGSISRHELRRDWHHGHGPGPLLSGVRHHHVP